MSDPTPFRLTPTSRGLSFFSSRSALAALTLGSLLGTVGCEENYITNKYYSERDAGQVTVPVVVDAATDTDNDAGTTDAAADAGGQDDPADGGAEPVGDAGDGDAGEPRPFMEGAPEVNSSIEELGIDVFGTVGNRYWFATDPAEVNRMNGNQGGGGPIIFNEFGDIYTPGGENTDKTYVESLFVTTAGAEGKTADFGKLQVRLLGQSTFRPWTTTTIPNLRLDMDYFTKDLRIDGFEHLRFNNSLVGSIFREKLTLQIYRELGYPAPQATFAWVGSNVWGPDAWVPYTLVEVYKKSFCKNWEEEFGGSCLNMWEYFGDFGQGIFNDPNNCQSDECDNTRVNELDALVTSTLPGPGYKDALAEWLDWDAFHEFQCLSWVLATGDDPLHNHNNVLLVEREDGKFQFLPYSTDISLGQEWYPVVSLTGMNSIAMGCQSDEACWADTIATCEDVIERFTALDPIGMLNDTYAELEGEGMLRDGDDGRHEMLQNWFEDRLVSLPVELEENRPLPQICEYPYVMCGDICMLEEECYNNCVPPVVGEPEPLPFPEPRPARAVGEQADVAIALPADPIVVPEPLPEGDAGVGEEPVPVPPVCPAINVYKVK